MSENPYEKYLMSVGFGPASGMPGFTPEYNVSKGWQPVDVGTLLQNQDLMSGYADMGSDLLLGAMTGNYDPAAFEDEVTFEEPERPDTPRLDMYGSGADPSMTLLIGYLDAGLSPRAAVERMVAEGAIKDPRNPDEWEQEPDTSEYDYLLSEAQAIFPEVAAMRKFDPTPIETRERSKAAQKFDDLGLPLPTERYGPEMFVDNYAGDIERGGQAAKQYEDSVQGVDYVKALTMRNPRTSLVEDDGGVMRRALEGKALPLGEDGDPVAPMNAEWRAQEVARQGLPVVSPTGARLDSPRSAGRQRAKAMGDDGGLGRRMDAQRAMLGSANVAAQAMLAARIAEVRGGRQADRAAAAGRSPLQDMLMGRAGL